MAPYLFVLTRTLNLSFMLKRDTYPFFFLDFYNLCFCLELFFESKRKNFFFVNEENK